MVAVYCSWYTNCSRIHYQYVCVDNKHKRIGFEYNVMHYSLRPIAIPTAGKGFWGDNLDVVNWYSSLGSYGNDDWSYTIMGEKYIIPQGFKFDGASIPKFLHTWLSPTGVLLMGGLVHDYAYKYETLLKSGQKETMGDQITQKQADQIFRDINIEQNGFHFLTTWHIMH